MTYTSALFVWSIHAQFCIEIGVYLGDDSRTTWYLIHFLKTRIEITFKALDIHKKKIMDGFLWNCVYSSLYVCVKGKRRTRLDFCAKHNFQIRISFRHGYNKKRKDRSLWNFLCDLHDLAQETNFTILEVMQIWSQTLSHCWNSPTLNWTQKLTDFICKNKMTF